MGEDKIENLFKKSILNNRLFDFAIGNDEYYILDRDNDEHWILGSWLYSIIPYLEKNKYDEEKVINMFLELIKGYPYKEYRIYDALLYHLYTYLYLLSENRISKILSDALVSDIFRYLEKYTDYLHIENISKFEEVKKALEMTKKKFNY